MNSRFLNEAKAIEARWNKHGLLDGISEKYERATAAKLLECQRLFNETGTWDCCDECKEREAKEKLLRSIEEPFEPSIEQKERL